MSTPTNHPHKIARRSASFTKDIFFSPVLISPHQSHHQPVGMATSVAHQCKSIESLMNEGKAGEQPRRPEQRAGPEVSYQIVHLHTGSAVQMRLWHGLGSPVAGGLGVTSSKREPLGAAKERPPSPLPCSLSCGLGHRVAPRASLGCTGTLSGLH